MVISNGKTTISASIDRETKVLLEKYAGELDLTLSKFSRNLIYIALDNFKVLKGAGVIKIARIFRDQLTKFPFYENMAQTRIRKAAENHVTISIVIDQEIKELLEQYSEDVGLSLKIFARNLIYVGLDQFKLLEKVGLVRVAFAFAKLIEGFRDFKEEARGPEFGPH